MPIECIAKTIRQVWTALVPAVGMQPFSKMAAHYFIFICIQKVFETLSRNKGAFAPGTQTNDLAEASTPGIFDKKVTAEVWDKSATVYQAWKCPMDPYVKHNNWASTNNKLYTELTNYDNSFM